MDVIPKLDRATTTDKARVKPAFEPKNLLDGTHLSDKDKVTFQKIIKRQRESDAKKVKRKLLKVAEKNETLSKTIEEKNDEITALKCSVQSLNDVLNSLPIEELRSNSSIASTKILDLSQKNRQLRVELDTAKNRMTKKELDLHKLEMELREAKEKQVQLGEQQRKAEGPQQAEELHNKINILQQKLFESRNRNSELQGQLKLAQKCLQQEVGESFNLNVLASQAAQSNWRGRAQQIIHLQQRVQELRERLDAVEQAGGIERLNGGYAASVLGGSVFKDHATAIQPASLDGERFVPTNRKSEHALHRLKVEGLEKEIEALRAQLEEQRGKTLALKVRNKTLNDDILKYRTKASSLEQQTDYNGLNLTAMNEQLNVQRRQFEVRLEAHNRELAEVQRERDEAVFKHTQVITELENLQSVLAAKEECIEQQSKELQRLEDDLKAICGDFLFSCRELHKEEFIAILDSLEAERNHLLEHIKTVEARLQQERPRNEALTEQSAKQKVRIARLEARIRELEKEQEAQAERKRRSQRVAEYTNSIHCLGGGGGSGGSGGGSVGSFVFENSSVSMLSLQAADAKAGEVPLTPAQILDLKQQLELSMEKVTMLEEKVTHLAEEKENDARTFQETLIHSKVIIRDALRHQRQEAIEDDGIGIPEPVRSVVAIN